MVKKKTEFCKTESGDVKITTYEEKMSRDFKGIWIPKEIWLSKKLSLIEKVLLSELHSLDGEKGCFASNAYLAVFLGISEINVSKHINKLKNLGYVKQIFFDGRKRILKTDLSLSISLDYRKQEVTLIDSDKYIYKDIEKNSNNIIQSSDELCDFPKNSTNRDNLKNRIKNNKSSKSPEISYDNIEIPLKRLLGLVFEEVIKIHPKTKKESFFGSKELSTCQNYYKHFKAGLSEKDFPAFFIRYKQNPEIIAAAKKGFTDIELVKMLKEVLKKYDIEYYPENKSKLPARLSSLFYNKQIDSVSYLIFFGMFEKSKKLLKAIPDSYPKLTQQVKKELFQDRNFSVSDENKLIRGMKNLIEIFEHENTVSIKSEMVKAKYERIEMDVQVYRNFGTPEKIINNWLLFMHNTIDSWDKYEENLSIFTNAWIEKFFTWINENLSIDYRKCDMKTLRDFHERKLIKEGKIILPEKTPKEKLKDLEKRIKGSTEGSYNRERLEEEKKKLLDIMSEEDWNNCLSEDESEKLLNVL